MAFGLIDTSFIDWPSNVDATYLRGLQTRSGVQFTEIAAILDGELAALNAGLDPLVASLVYPTTSEFARTSANSAFTVHKRSQYTLPRPQQTERLAVMFGIDDWDVGLGWTEDGIEEMSLDDIREQARAMRDGWELRYRRETLQRLFSDAEVSVAAGTAALSPGFAGSGTGGNVFSGAYPNGLALPGNYSHYYRDATANRAAVVKSARDRLKKWNRGPFDLIASQAFIDALVLLPDYVSAGSELIRLGSGTAEAQVDPTQFVGVFDKDIRVHSPLTDFTEDVAAIYKTYGDFNPLNPLAWRYDPLKGRDVIVKSRQLYPLAEAVVQQRFGINVNNRTGAALITIAASGSYTPPVIA